jgi:ferredoxin
MSSMITKECIGCAVCVSERPNEAIGEVPNPSRPTSRFRKETA